MFHGRFLLMRYLWTSLIAHAFCLCYTAQVRADFHKRRQEIHIVEVRLVNDPEERSC